MPTIRLDDGTEIPLDDFESLTISWAICEAYNLAEKHHGLDQDDFDALKSVRDKLRDANFGHYFRYG
ncbi:MAG: hypothetical protein M0R06_24575 [Sphaerochaeta sp.]|jgi:hypothetical protein|nr:hypothetical protein [Sphaerochaeta sp.]